MNQVSPTGRTGLTPPSLAPPPHHVVDLLDGEAQPAGLETCGQVRLQNRLQVDALVEVVASDRWRLVRKFAASLKDRLRGHGRGFVRHFP